MTGSKFVKSKLMEIQKLIDRSADNKQANIKN